MSTSSQRALVAEDHNVNMTVAPTSVVRLLEADPDFARAIPDGDRELANRALTLRVQTAGPGDLVSCNPREAVALLLVEGAIWRDVLVGPSGAPQLLGPGAVLLCDPPANELLPVETAATALQPSRLALLDRRFLMATTKWTSLTSILHSRLAQQERDLGALAAIGQLPRVDERLVALFWHLAERWGRVGQDGVHLPLKLTHATLGRFVGARRPTVSLALATMRDAGIATRRPDGTWTLLGRAPETVRVRSAREAVPPLDLFPVAA
jgi:DNA-binding transcriptional ArsR family regulator